MNQNLAFVYAEGQLVDLGYNLREIENLNFEFELARQPVGTVFIYSYDEKYSSYSRSNYKCNWQTRIVSNAFTGNVYQNSTITINRLFVSIMYRNEDLPVELQGQDLNGKQVSFELYYNEEERHVYAQNITLLEGDNFYIV